MKLATFACMTILLTSALPVRATEKEKKEEPTLKFKGDLRYRHEMVEWEEQKADHRHRIRMRFGAFSQISEELELGFQLASGGGDPISTNQTIGDGFTKKPITIDLAYFRYMPVKGLAIIGGKMNNPFWRPGSNQLIWDSDLSPEGLALNYSHSLDNMKFFATGGLFWMADRNGDDKDGTLLGGQVGGEMKFGDFRINLAGGLHNYSKIQGYAPLYRDRAYGNTLDAEGNFENDYNILDVGLTLTAKVADIPFQFFGQFARNMAADEENTAFLAGLNIGEAKKAMGWTVFYNYRQLPRDAVFGLMADSDFINGGTGGKGHFAGGTFALTDSILLALILQFSNLDDDDETKYTRVQLDFSVKF